MAAMGIDREKLLIQLSRLEEHLLEMEKIKEQINRAKEGDIVFPAAERILQLSIEDCLNIGSHIISARGFKRADTYREVFIILREEKVIGQELAEKMVRLASFRNRLVHLYWDVTPEEVKEKINNSDVFRQYALETLKQKDA